MADPLAPFHPGVGAWFRAALGEPTAVQAEGWEAIRAGQATLVAAPTGSGKTLAAFLAALDALVRESVEAGGLPDQTRVLYVSPLKALSADIEKNLALPLAGIDAELRARGLAPHGIRVALRTGDTPARERALAVKRPPHLLVTTPESLYVLLTSASGRRLLSTVRSVIVDEIHAVVGSKRGSHLALSLERLEALTSSADASSAAPGAPALLRIGLSATQRPVEEVARFLVGAARVDASGVPTCRVIDAGHARALDLALELPGSDLDAVMSAEVWGELHRRMAALVGQCRTTLVFVNTRRLAERLARSLGELLGPDAVTAHHGSLSRELRLRAEQRLRAGELRVLVATSSLELGIDVGFVDLVCQVGSPRSIAAFLQRVGRSGHFLAGLPRGRLFPTSRDDLVECLALLEAVRRGELDRVRVLPAPLDVLAQQVVAEVALQEWPLEALFERVRRAWPYRELPRERFDELLTMLAEGFATRRGRRSAYLHLDRVNGVVRGRRGAALTAVCSGGAIPESAEYAVVTEPEGARVGTVHEDFAIESAAGDVFQLGTTSWKLLRMAPGILYVEDARGQPPTLPFWIAEAPGRSRELSDAVERLVARAEDTLRAAGPEAATRELATAAAVEPAHAAPAIEHLAGGLAALGALPRADRLVAERFFDEAGNQHLVIHSRRGARLNRAYGLALRKSFCRSFDFELQAAATDDALVLSLGPTHSFPVEDAFGLLHAGRAASLLEQAVLDAPLFAVRWRWAATIALAIPRMRGGKKTPPPLQRMMADDLLALAFPQAQACLENLTGDREIPDHPLVQQALRDCTEEALDGPRLQELLEGLRTGAVSVVARELSQPSPLAAEILAARPYAFLDDAPLEERRTQAVVMRRWRDTVGADDLGALDPEAIARVRDEAFPDPRDADEAHDALVVHGFLTEAEARGGGPVPRADLRPWLQELAQGRRACRVEHGAGLWVAAERLAELERALGPARREPAIAAVGGGAPREPEAALVELLRSRLEALGPVTAAELAASCGVEPGRVEVALAALEGEGFVLRGRFTPAATRPQAGSPPSQEATRPQAGSPPSQEATRPQAGSPPSVEWCERRLLARIHRATLERLRREIEPVSLGELSRFLVEWQHAAPVTRARGLEGLAAVLTQLEGLELPAAAWEADVLPARVEGYDPAWLDALCLSGRFTWRRATPARSAVPVKSTPIAFVERGRRALWATVFPEGAPVTELSSNAAAVHAALARSGAAFFDDLPAASGLLPSQVEPALGELVARGLATADGWSGLRALLTTADKRPGAGHPLRRRRHAAPVHAAGRWSVAEATPPVVTAPVGSPAAATAGGEEVEFFARALLRRWGVVTRRLFERESTRLPWREVARALRRLEARGEIRGGRFVAVLTGEQFALPEAVTLLREVRRRAPAGALLSLSAADPLAQVAGLAAGPRLPALAGNRVVLRDGVPVAALEAGQVRIVGELPEAERAAATGALVRRAAPRSVDQRAVAAFR